MSKATPRPWVHDTAIVTSGDGCFVCTTTMGVVDRGAIDDAALIVRAVNHHDELVELVRLTERTLTQAVGIIVEFGDLNGFRNLSDEDLGKAVKQMAVLGIEVVDKARAVLAKIEVKP